MLRGRLLRAVDGGLRGLVLLAEAAAFLPVLLNRGVQLLRGQGLAADGAERLAFVLGEGRLAILEVLGAGAVASRFVGAFGLDGSRFSSRALLVLDASVELRDAGAFPVEPRFLLAEGGQCRDERERALVLPREALDGRLDAAALLGDLALGGGDGILNGPGLRGEVGEHTLLVAGLLELGVGLLCPVRVRERLADHYEVGVEGGDGVGAALDGVLARGEAVSRVGDGARAALVLGGRETQLLRLLLLRLKADPDLRALAFDALELLLDGGRFRESLLVVTDEAFLDGGVGLGGLAAIVGVAGKLLVAVEAKDLAQDLFALRGGLHGELVRAALDEEDAVDEGLVVHVDAAVQLGLRLAGGAAGDGAKAALAIDLEEVEGAGAAARALADDAVGIAVDLEVELDSHVAGAVADAVVLDAATGFAPEGPGDGVEEGGLAVAVLAGEGGEVEGGEVELAVAVGEEVAEAEAARDHGEVSAGSRRWACQRTPEASRSTTTATP